MGESEQKTCPKCGGELKQAQGEFVGDYEGRHDVLRCQDPNCGGFLEDPPFTARERNRGR